MSDQKATNEQSSSEQQTESAPAVEAASSDQPVFRIKKPSRSMKKHVRQAHAAVDDSSDVAASLSETRMFQQLRKRRHGIDTHVENEEEAESEETLRTVDDPEAQKKKGFGLQTFQQQHNDNVVDAHLDAYVESKLEQFRANQRQKQNPSNEHDDDAVGDTSASSAPEPPPRDAQEVAAQQAEKNLSEEDLYKLPESLQPTSRQRKKVDYDLEQESGERWLTGITEVALPISVKLQNIERTEAAKHALFEAKAQRIRANSAGGSFAANFNLHKREWTAARRAERTGEPENPQQRVTTEEAARRKPAQPGESGGRMPIASDDRAVSSFIKRQRFRR